MIELMAQIFLELVIVAGVVAACDGCRKVRNSLRRSARATDEAPPEGPASA